MLEKTLEVSSFINVSLSNLIEKLKQSVTGIEPLPKDIAVGLHVVYKLNSTPWRKHRKDWVCHHLAMPSAATVVSECDKALCQAGYLKPGQVTLMSGAKFVDDAQSNVLNVTIKQVTERLKSDNSFFDLEFLNWYENQCAAHGVEPSIEEFIRRRNSLKKKKSAGALTEKDKQAFSTLDQTSALPEWAVAKKSNESLK